MLMNSFLESGDLVMSSADNLCKQFGPRSDIVLFLIWIQSFDTTIVFLKEFFEKVNQ